MAQDEVTEELVERALAGEQAALEQIVRSLERPIFQIAVRMLRNQQDAEDATQEALLRVVTRLGQYRAESRFSTWAFRIAVRRVLDQRGVSGASFERFAADLADGLDPNAAERIEDAIDLRKLKTRCSRALLQCLDRDHRIAYILGEILELPSADAAAILEIEPATFRKRSSRARAQLTQFLGHECGVVNPQAPCACHRRLQRARERGRLQPSELDVPLSDLVRLRSQISQLSELHRAAHFYRADADTLLTPDFVAKMRATLARFDHTEVS